MSGIPHGSRPHRRALIASVLLLSVAAGAVYVLQLARTGGIPPANVILISIDTLRADHLGVYGYERNTSPNLDRLAGRSTVFTRAVAQAPVTAPSHASLFTSLYYSVHQLGGTGQRLPSWRMTLAELLRAQGFATWGFVDGGYLHSNFGFDQGFDHYDDVGGGIAQILDKVEHWLNTHAADRFFLFIHCYDVHSPYAPPPPYDKLFEESPYTGDFEATTANLKAVADLRRRISAEDVRHVVALYDGGIRYTDEHLGRFLERLERDGLLESTIVIVTSDHGEEFLEHGSMLHGQIYFMPDLHVPLIFFIPGLQPRTMAGPVELIDVLPTVLDLLGLPPYSGAMGRSLAPSIRGQEAADRNRVAYAERGPNVDLWPWYTVVSDGYQLFFNVKSGERRLFDTRNDPAAARDIADSETAVAERMLADLEERRRRAETVSRQELWPATEAARVEEATREKLRALGYLDD